MATSIPLDPLARARLKTLKRRMEREMSRDASERTIVSAIVFGVTPAQTAGMLDEFVRARADARTTAPDAAD